MKPRFLFLLFLTAAFAFTVTSDQFKGLHRLEGTWAMETKKGILYEQWKKVSDSEMRSRGFRLNGSDTVVLESIQLIEKEEGIFYIPVVENQNQNLPVSFKLTSSEENKYIFENKLHDFPQRVIYHLVSDDSIRARIEGSRNGQSSGTDFYFRRIK